MPSRRRLAISFIAAACCFLGGGPMRLAQTGTGAHAAPFDAAPNICEQAGIAAEQAAGLPSGLLLAIGRVESGRWDAAHGRVTAWPWAINAAGKGQWFETKDVAAQTVKALLDGGTRSIDVGCFQINLMHHPAAFTDLNQAFDPDANARYAARFLLSLYSRTGTWEAAVAAYHSFDPVLGFAYREQVFSMWSTAPVLAAASMTIHTGTAPMLAAVSRPMPAIIAGVQIWTPMPIGAGATVVAMPGAPDSTQVESRIASSETTSSPLPVVSYHAMPRPAVPHR